MLAYWPVSPLDSSHILPSTTGDPIQAVWFLAWTPFALLHGHNLLFSSYLDYPSGVNLATNTSTSVLGLLGSPITLTLGPMATANFLMRLALASSATSMCLVLRSWIRWWPAAFFGGLLYGFGSYMSVQGAVHLDLCFVPIPPLLLWCLSELLVVQRRSPVRVGLLLGLLCAAQLLINAEVLADCVVVGVVGVLVLAIWHRREVVSRARTAGPGIALAAASFAVVSGYPLWLLVAGPGHVTGPLLPVWETSQERADLLSLVVQKVAAPMTRPDGAPYLLLGKLARATDPDAYLGLPLTAVTLVFVVVWRRVGIIKVAGILALAAFVLSLGPHLNVNGAVTAIPLPGLLLAHVPLLDNTVWYRYALEVTLFVSMVFAVGLDRLATHWQICPVEPVEPHQERPAPATAHTTSVTERHERTSVRAEWSTRPFDTGRGARSLLPWALCLGIPAVSLFPLAHPYPIASTPMGWPSQLVSSLRESVPPGGVVLTFPPIHGPTDAPMAWQAIDQMQFRLVGGYAFAPTPMGSGSSGVSSAQMMSTVSLAITKAGTGALASTLPGVIATAESTCTALTGLLSEYSVDAVVVWPTGTDPSLVGSLLQPALGAPSKSFPQALVWYHVPQDLKRQPGCSATEVSKFIGAGAVAAPGFSLSAWTVPAGDRTVMTTTAAPNGGTAPVFTAVTGRRFFTFIQLAYPKPQDWSGQSSVSLTYKGTGSGKVFQVVFTFGSGSRSAKYTIVDDSTQWKTAAFATARPGIPSSDWSHVLGASVALSPKSETMTIALGLPVPSGP
jgi:hypothetical protein